MSELVFVFPMPLNRGNSRGQSRYVNHHKKRYWRELNDLLSKGSLPDPPEEPWEKVEYTVTYFGWSEMDDDNAVARVKWILDWLVNEGYIVDDKRKHCRLAAVPEQAVDRKHQRVLLTLKRVA